MRSLMRLMANARTSKWQYIKDLNTLQEEIGFTIANKLKHKHIMWTKHKMNVSMAAQTLSSSAASAIDFLWDEMGVPEFKESEHTTEFIRRIAQHLIF